MATNRRTRLTGPQIAAHSTYSTEPQLTQADPLATRYTSALLQYPYPFPSQ